jgi:sulfur-oxidizing protein SoxY
MESVSDLYPAILEYDENACQGRQVDRPVTTDTLTRCAVGSENARRSSARRATVAAGLGMRAEDQRAEEGGPMTRRSERIIQGALGALVAAFGLLVATGTGAQSELDTEQWKEWRKKLFADRPIQEDPTGVFQFEVPVRPESGAAVPIAIKIGGTQSAERFVKRIVVVIDRNPEPLAAVFHLTPDAGQATIETEMRVETHSPVRAIVEMSDGKLVMAAKFVKAAGGCSVAPVLDADAAAAAARLGQMQVRLPETVTRNEPNRIQLIVNHPNYTGFQKHPLKHYMISAHYVTDIKVSYADRPVLTAQTTIASSEDPSFRFFFTPHEAGQLRVEVKDSRGQQFAKAVEVTPR